MSSLTHHSILKRYRNSAHGVKRNDHEKLQGMTTPPPSENLLPNRGETFGKSIRQPNHRLDSLGCTRGSTASPGRPVRDPCRQEGNHTGRPGRGRRTGNGLTGRRGLLATAAVTAAGRHTPSVGWKHYSRESCLGMTVRVRKDKFKSP